MNIKKQRTMGKILAIGTFSVITLVYLIGAGEFSHYSPLRGILFSVDWLKLLFLMLLYALIPGVPTVILRAKFRIYARNWIALAATIISGLCLIIMIFGVETMLYDNEWISTFIQFTLISSVPVLYCIAFFGIERGIWAALAPFLMYFLSFFLRYAIIYGLGGIVGFLRYFDLTFILFSDPKQLDPEILTFMLTTVLMSVVFAVWALLCIFISRMIYRFINHLEIKNNKKLRHNKMDRFNK